MKNLNKIIGGIIVSSIFIGLFIFCVIAYGWKAAIISWSIAIGILFILTIGIILLCENNNEKTNTD